jgi:hypothetical protein
VTRIRDRIAPNDFQALIAAVQSMDDKRIEDETVRIARAIKRTPSTSRKPATPRKEHSR